MAGITLAEAEAHLAEAQAAYSRALGKKAYTVGSRQMTAQDIDKLLDQVKFWEGKVAELSSGGRGMRIRGGTPT